MSTVKVKITARNFTLGEKLYGTGGEYPVDEKTARWIVNNGKGTIIEGSLPAEQTPADREISDAQFLAVVKRNAKEVVCILEEAMRQPVGTEALTSEPPFNAMSETEEAKDGKDTPSTDDDTASSSETKLDDTQNASSENTDIPEGFPGREVLIAAGITKAADIPTTKEDLMNVEGMNARLANQIGVKLAQE